VWLGVNAIAFRESDPSASRRRASFSTSGPVDGAETHFSRPNDPTLLQAFRPADLEPVDAMIVLFAPG
jgi:hypothetical protein